MTRDLLVATCLLAACDRTAPRPVAPVPPEDAGYVELPENHTDTQGCIKLVVGTAREQAELCEDITDGFWRVTRQIVRVVRDGKTIPVLQVLTKIEGEDTGNLELELRLRIATNGMSAMTIDGEPSTTSRQPGPLDNCRSPGPTSDDGPEREFGVPTYRELRRELCDARGTYRWNGTAFQRVSRASPSRS